MSKSGSRSGIDYPSALQDALAWLGAPPADDPLRDLAPLRTHLGGIASVAIPPLQYFKILELFQTRANLTGSTVKPLLLDATLPVAKRLRTVAHGLMDVHEALAAGYSRVIHETTREKLHSLKRTPVQLCALGLANLAQQFEVAQLISAPAPADFWECVLRFHGLIRADTPSPAEADEADEAMRRMKALLALAAAQPEGFSPRETAFLAEYLRSQAMAVEIGPAADGRVADDYWLDATQGFPPTATSRRTPPGNAALHFSCAALSRLAGMQLAHIEQGERPESFGLPHEILLADYRSVLARAAERWASPPKRQTHRRRHGYRVEVCTHLGSLWQQLRSGDDAAETAVELATSDWMVLNESPSGYAIMHVAGELGGLVSGSAIGLRPAPGEPWNICVVRWARSENPEHIELGLELVSPLAEAVRIARHDTNGEQPPIPALLLPPLPALHRGEALLTARGYFAPGAFTLVQESPDRVKVTACAAGQLSMHTACIEIFEFERNLSAL